MNTVRYLYFCISNYTSLRGRKTTAVAFILLMDSVGQDSRPGSSAGRACLNAMMVELQPSDGWGCMEGGMRLGNAGRGEWSHLEAWFLSPGLG